MSKYRRPRQPLRHAAWISRKERIAQAPQREQGGTRRPQSWSSESEAILLSDQNTTISASLRIRLRELYKMTNQPADAPGSPANYALCPKPGRVWGIAGRLLQKLRTT